MNKSFFFFLAVILFPSFVFAGDTARNQTEIIDRRIAEEEKNIEALNKQYESALKQKQKLDARIKDRKKRQQKQVQQKQTQQKQARKEHAVIPPAGSGTPVRKNDVKRKADTSKEAAFLKEQKAREVKLAEEERLRKLQEADNRKQEQARLQHEAQVKRETVRRDAQLQLQETARKKEERKLEAQRVQQEKAQALEARRQAATMKQEQRALTDFFRQKCESERREAKRERHKRPAAAARQELRPVRQVPRTAEMKQEAAPDKAVAEMRAESRVQRQKKVSGVLDRIEKMDAWVKDKFW